MPEQVRVGFLLDSYRIYAWQHLAMRKVLGLDFVSVPVVVLNADPVRGVGDPLVYKIYRALDKKLFRPKPDAFGIMDAHEIFKGAEEMRVRPLHKKHTDSFSEEDVEKIAGYRLDVIIRFGFRILKGEILKAARFGIWSYHHGDNGQYRGGPPGFWEVIEGTPVTGCILQVLTEDLDSGQVLCKSVSRTDKLSVCRNKNRVYWKSASFISRQLSDLHRLGGDAFLEKLAASNRELSFYSRKLYTLKDTGSSRLLLTLSAHLGKNLIRKAGEKLLRKQWLLLYAFRNGLSTSLYKFKKILPPSDRYWADPCVVDKDGKYYVFIEEYLFSKRKGHISFFEIDEEGNRTEPQTILEREYHLSYPLVFAHDGQYYMIPESRKAGTVDLYKCERFPDRWVFLRTLLRDIEAVDGTVLFSDGKFWLFANVVDNKGASSFDELFLFYSDSLEEGQWQPHPCNPIVSDVTKARPAGRVLQIDGSYYRPSQDCSGNYGRGLRIHRIKELNENSYREEEVAFIEADIGNGITNIHTLSFDHRLTMMDAQRRFFPFL